MGSKRDNIVRELVETERSYVSSLQTLVTTFLDPLSSGAGSLSPKDARHVFANIRQILQFQELLLAALTEELDAHGPDLAQVGRVMVEFTPWFMLYTAYVTSFATAQTRLKEAVARSKGLAARVAECEAKSGGVTLGTLLIMPVQRIPRYKMLLEELKKVRCLGRTGRVGRRWGLRGGGQEGLAAL